MEPSHCAPTASISKPKAVSFFSLQELKGSQPAVTPSAWVAHLEEESANQEECAEGKDPDDIKV